MYARVSYSALERFEVCSTRQLLHAERKRSELSPKYVLVGNALHYGLAANIDTEGRLRVTETALWEFERRLREENHRWSREDAREAYEKVKAAAHNLEVMIDKRWDRMATRSTSIRSEVRLFKAFRGWSIEGYLDVMVGVGSEIWDLKTGQWSQDQLVFYDVLSESVLGVRPREVGVIEPLGRGFITLPVSDEHRVDMRNRIRTFVQRVTAGDWAYEGYSQSCSWCRSKPWCPKWEAARSGSLTA